MKKSTIKIKDIIERELFIQERTDFLKKRLPITENLEDMKKEIIKLLGDVDDIEVLHKIINNLYKESYESILFDIQHSKNIDNKTMKEFSDIFYKINGTPEDKMEFLRTLDAQGVLSDDAVLNAKNVTSLMSSNVLKCQNDFAIRMVNELKDWTANLGAKSGVGKGEGLFIMLTNTGSKAKKGDIIIKGKEIEVKANHGGANGGRLQGTDNNWVAPSSVFPDVLEDLEKLVGESLPSDPNYWNLLSSKLGNWNKYLKGINSKKVASFFSKTFKRIFGNSVADFSWVEKNIKKDGTIDEDFLNAFAAFQYDYYRKLEKFQYILLLNRKTNNFIIAQSTKDYANLIKSGIIVYSGFSWKEPRNITYQIGLSK